MQLAISVKIALGKSPGLAGFLYIDDYYTIAFFYTREFPVSKINETNAIFKGLV
jgi:hypothetical protein